MEVIALSPLHVTTLPWRRDGRSPLLTVVCKATFDLLPGEMRLSQQQEPLHEQDQREDDAGRSARIPGDLWPYKQRADITLIGHAYAPRGAPVRSLIARLVSGSIDKSIAVHGDRAVESRTEITPFTRMPLRYDRAAGGPGTINPSGLSASADRLPNLEPVRQGEEAIPTIGFGPLPPDWPQRRVRLKAPLTTWSPADPVPEDFDPLFFNAAPPDQQPAALRDDQPLTLENLHPDHPRLSTRLPGLRPQAFVDRGQGQAQELELRPDSLWIDTDRARCTVTWRAHFPLAQADEPGRILVALTTVRQQLGWEDMKRLEVAVGRDPAPREAARKVRSRPDVPSFVPEEEDDEENDTVMMARQALMQPRPPPRRVPPPLPSAPSAAPPPPPSIPGIPAPPPIPSLSAALLPPATPPAPSSATATATLPVSSAALASNGGASSSPTPAAGASSEARRTRFDPEATNTDFFVIGEHTPIFDATPAWLAQVGPSGPAVPSVTAQPLPAPPPAPAPTLPPPQAPPQPASPPLASSHASPSHASPSLASPLHASQLASPQLASPQPASLPAPTLPPPAPAAPAIVKAAPPPLPTNLTTTEARSPWAAGSASNQGKVPLSAPVPIKSAPTPEHARSRTPTLTGSPRPAQAPAPNDVIDLIWFDPASLPGVRARWGTIIDELEFAPLDPRHDLPVDDPAAARDRHHAFGVITQASATDAGGVSRAMLEAISDRGRFTPPLLVISGELRFPFDEIETLKAASAAAKPLARDDKKLGDLLEMVNELLGTPLLQGAPGMVESLLRDLNNAVQQSKRALPVKYLDAHLERVLLEQRRYQKRTVFGGPSLRTLLVPTRETTAIPAYLPEAVADKLPLVTQMKVKLIATANPSQDQYESHPHALRVVALGRIMATDGWKR